MTLASLVLSAAQISATSNPAGYLAPLPKKVKGGVLVLHPWWGLNSDVKLACRKLSAAGYAAFAPDLFGGKTATTEKGAKELVAKNRDQEEDKLALIEQSARYLQKLSGKKTIGVIGYSYGAFYALKYSNFAPDKVKSVVIYYGTGEQDFGRSKASYLGHFAENDSFEPASAVADLRELLKSQKRPAEFHIYKGKGHWFAEASIRKAYDKAAADKAWSRTLAFLKKTL